jgi:hypothetical protein
MACDKHPHASGPGALCPVCLLEQALAPARRHLTILVPLGHSARASVYVVRQAAPSEALLRLKLWHHAAPAGFLDGIAMLVREIEAVPVPGLVPPLAACLDADGRPAVLSAFRQGVPMVASVRAGALDADAALALLDPLWTALARCHRAGLAHGSIVPGNVLVEPGRTAAFVVDFGILPLLLGPGEAADAVASDAAALAALRETVRSSAVHAPRS